VKQLPLSVELKKDWCLDRHPIIMIRAAAVV
jgi:hypothetical protein